MTTAILFILVFSFTVLACLVGTALYIDKWLHGVDKDKYLAKSLKKKLKKGMISETEYEQGILASRIGNTGKNRAR